MTIIVDANIIISGILNPTKFIGALLTGVIRNDHIYISPEFLKAELLKHRSKIAHYAKCSPKIIEELQEYMCKRINFYPEESLPSEIWNHATALTDGVDIKDSVYIAFCLFYQSPLWSGDLKLKSHLQSKGFDIVRSTQEIMEL